MTPGSDVQPAIDAFLTAAKRGIVHVVLDSRVEKVVLPTALLGLPEVRLNFARPQGANDWCADAKGLGETMSFSGVRSWVQIPWAAILEMHIARPTQEKPKLKLVREGDDGT